jgi:hypothetical protein
MVERAAALLDDDRDRLVPLADTLAGTGCVYQQARTLVLAGDEAESGAADSWPTWARDLIGARCCSPRSNHAVTGPRPAGARSVLGECGEVFVDELGDTELLQDAGLASAVG